MSHYAIIVLTDGNKSVEELLAPYDENTQVPEYEKECYCATHYIDYKCDECDGNGVAKTVYNPKSKWDWYEEGGRWNNYLFEHMPNYSWNEKYPTQGNRVVAEELLDIIQNEDNKIPFAFVTPDGEWHSIGKMGWFGSSRDDISEDEWKRRVIELLRSNIDTIGVVMDLHI